MGHHGMGQMQMDGSQNLHGSGLPAYPHLDPEIIAAASAGIHITAYGKELGLG